VPGDRIQRPRCPPGSKPRLPPAAIIIFSVILKEPPRNRPPRASHRGGD